VAGQEAKAGYARITWPNGIWRPRRLAHPAGVYQQEGPLPGAARFFDIGLGMCIPTMMAYAAPRSQRYVKPALHGQEVWCQLFSEPAQAPTWPHPTRAERAKLPDGATAG